MKNPTATFCRSLSHAEKLGKKSMLFRKGDNKNVIDVCRLLLKLNYIKGFTFVEESHSGKIHVQLTGRINKVIFFRARKCKTNEIDTLAQRILPSRNIGALVLSTASKGLVTHREAIAAGESGKMMFAVY